MTRKARETFTCPRRRDSWFPGQADETGVDVWRDDKTCSFCGSLSESDFWDHIYEGGVVTPTDKAYKVYLKVHLSSEHKKFYFQHLSTKGREEFVQRMNENRLNIGYPGNFYVLPFFVAYDS